MMNPQSIEPFVRWGASHWGALAVVAVTAAALLWWAARMQERGRIILGKTLGAVFLLTFLIECVGRIIRDHWEPWQDRLPLHFCSLMTLVCFVALWYRRPWACAVAFFGVLTVSIQGLITPMLYDGFPSAGYFAFFVGHGLLLISALYIPLGLKWRARPWDDLRTLAICNVYLLLMIPFNILIDSNYGFTRFLPKNSVLDYFGDAPWCFLTLQIPAFIVLRALYLLVRQKTASVNSGD